MDFEALRRETVGAIVAADERAAEVLRRFGVDHCCGRGLTLEAACAARGVEPDAVLRAIEAAVRPAGGVSR